MLCLHRTAYSAINPGVWAWHSDVKLLWSSLNCTVIVHSFGKFISQLLHKYHFYRSTGVTKDLMLAY